MLIVPSFLTVLPPHWPPQTSASAGTMTSSKVYDESFAHPLCDCCLLWTYLHSNNADKTMEAQTACFPLGFLSLPCSNVGNPVLVFLLTTKSSGKCASLMRDTTIVKDDDDKLFFLFYVPTSFVLGEEVGGGKHACRKKCRTEPFDPLIAQSCSAPSANPEHSKASLIMIAKSFPNK